MAVLTVCLAHEPFFPGVPEVEQLERLYMSNALTFVFFRS